MATRTTLAREPETVAAAAARLRAWISSGACQSLSGAFLAWFDLTHDVGSYAYPEISGYALTYLAGRASLSPRERSAAHRAAEWLAERVRAGNLAARDGWDNNAVYLFDVGMIASGLLSFARRAQAERYIEPALRLVRFLRKELSLSGSISPLASGGPPSGREAWSTRGVAHLGKLVQTFLLAEEFGSPGDPSHTARLTETVKRLQADDGRIRTDDDETVVMLHPHLYAAEGLWIWGSVSGDDDALERARAAVEWVWTWQLEQGGLPRAAGDGKRIGAPLEQSDVTAQAVRLALVLGSRAAAVDRAIARMIEVARGDGRGLGIVYQPGSGRMHLNTWATLFAAQALELAVAEAPSVSWKELV